MRLSIRSVTAAAAAATLSTIATIAITFVSISHPRAAAPAANDRSDGPTFQVGGGQLKIEVCDEDVVRVAFARDPAFFARRTLATEPRRCPGARWRLSQDADEATVATAKLDVRVRLDTGAVSFRDPAGHVILAERAGGRTLAAAVVQGAQTNHAGQQWEPDADEALYGLGQHQQDLVDIKNYDLDLRQWNTEIFVPFLVSSRGYGILWDNTSCSRFGDPGNGVPLPDVKGLYSASPRAQPGDVAPGNGTVDWSGAVTPPADGDYVFRTYSAGDIKVWIGGQLVIDHWRQGWLPDEDLARVHLSAGRPVTVRLAWRRDIGVEIVRLLWKPPAVDSTPTTQPAAPRPISLWSKVADGVDYTFVYGPELDRVIAGYRQLTGTAPMMPRWAFGLWQSRERYRTAREATEVVEGFRRRGVPVDVIVQDWRYWPEGQWGSHLFDPARFPNPAAWIADLHQRLHARLMISVWPKFYPGTAPFAALQAAGFLYQANLEEEKKDFLGSVFTYYDAFDAEARQLYWSQIEQALASKGVDAWWMDASEPEIVEGPWKSVAEQVAASEAHMNPTALGSGARVLNAYALEQSRAIYEGQRGSTAGAGRRVFILTRNGFAGQQRYAAASWSGDVTSTWTALRKQIPAGIGFALSGVPYWTVDAGGFAVPDRFAHAARGSAALDEWREMQLRWFEYATFLPLLRVHGQAPKREMWELGGDGSPATDAELKLDRLRYRLLPYTYSLAGAVTRDGATILRPLVMDFRADARARTLGDQFMFGPALMVSPVVTYKTRARPVYLPATQGGWYDFWSGAAVADGAAGATISAPAPPDAIPVHVRAGSIVAFGPELQYTDEKPAEPVTLVVYTGADGAFTLYEDDGVSYDYEKGASARIPLRWSESTRTLTIGRREGSFPGMLGERTFQIVLASRAHPAPLSFDVGTLKPDKTVRYRGDAVAISLPEVPR